MVFVVEEFQSPVIGRPSAGAAGVPASDDPHIGPGPKGDAIGHSAGFLPSRVSRSSISNDGPSQIVAMEPIGAKKRHRVRNSGLWTRRRRRYRRNSRGCMVNLIGRRFHPSDCSAPWLPDPDRAAVAHVDAGGGLCFGRDHGMRGSLASLSSLAACCLASSLADDACQEPKVCRLTAGAEWIRNSGSGASGEADAILPVKDRPRYG